MTPKDDRWIGPYRLVEVLGEGGMGTVYLAEQHEPVRRVVALKLMRSSFAGPVAAARFNVERQTLARLGHPNIAAMYDAGTTDGGFPFFAMERVEGLPLIDYCDACHLTIRRRIELFIQICKGVQHAHQKGVIHRDLKPSNVLVTEIEGQPVPKIIDFGVAKAVDRDPGEEVTALMTGQAIIGTPGYMSPEAMRAGDLDTRSDIYSLGVLLYELIAGVWPHEHGDLPWPLAIERMEQRTPPPQTRFRELGTVEKRVVAEARGEDERSLERVLSGDLGAVARKAIAFEREERYESAAALAADLTRYLNHEPVLATPPSLGYRARKFARRHRAGVIAGAIVALAIVGGIAGTTIGMLRAQRARAEAEAVSTFLSDLLQDASPWERKNETTVRQLLAEAAGRIQHELKDQPAARAELLLTIGSAEFHLGHLDSAERLLREAMRVRVQLDGAGSPLIAPIQNELGLVHKHQGRLDEAERLLRASLVLRENAYGHVHGSVARGTFDLASILALRGKNEEAEAAYRDALALREKLFATRQGDSNENDIAMTMNGLGIHLARTGRLAEAEQRMRQSLGIRKRRGDVGYAFALSTLELGGVVARQNRLAEAERLDREGLAALQKFVEPEDERLEKAREQLADVVSRQRQVRQ